MAPIHDLKMEQYPWILRFAYVFGIPALLSVYLIWLMAARVESKLDVLEDHARRNGADIQYSVKSDGEQVMRLDQIYRLLQRICINTAETAAERSSCFATERPTP